MIAWKFHIKRTQKCDTKREFMTKPCICRTTNIHQPRQFNTNTVCDVFDIKKVWPIAAKSGPLLNSEGKQSIFHLGSSTRDKELWTKSTVFDQFFFANKFSLEA